MSYLYNHKALGISCIVSENRKDKPHISKESQKVCPFCEDNAEMLEYIWLERELEDGDKIRVVNNKYPVIGDGLEGVHDVIIETLSHEKTIEALTCSHWVALIEVLQERWRQVADNTEIECIQMFKNYGERAGASISHLHWQLIALSKTPETLQKHYERIEEAYEKDQCIFCEGRRDALGEVILEDENWQVISPSAATFPHETWLIVKKHIAHFGMISQEIIKELGSLMYLVTDAYKRLLPDLHYNICLMSGRPKQDTGYHFYIKIVPRIGNVAGFELATLCHINTVDPKEHAKMMKHILDRREEERHV